MIQKLEYETHNGNGNVYGAIPSDAEIIAKVNEVIDYINSLPGEKPSEELEEAAEEYAILDEEGKWKDGGKYKGFIAGAEWQKEQMMKDAVEGEIVKDIYNNKLALTAKNINLDGFKFGDKVKMIIVKNEE